MAMEVEFYETESGKTPVANFIDSLIENLQLKYCVI